MAKTDSNARRLQSEVLAIYKRLQDIGRYHERDLERFRAFMTSARIAMEQARRRACGLKIDAGLEDEYAKIAQRWGKEGMQGFSECLGLLTLALEAHREDVLGPLFMAMELGDDYRGQFFTPNSVSRMMAEMNAIGVSEFIKQKGFVTVSEPACGSGGMIIEFAEAIRRQGYEPRRYMRAHLIDKDRICADMAYIQMTLLAIPAVVVHGDALSLEQWWSAETLFWPLPAPAAAQRKKTAKAPPAKKVIKLKKKQRAMPRKKRTFRKAAE